ncbi:MAG: hypothetical protein AABX66_02720 [Nanoarchaeota archaeon]
MKKITLLFVFFIICFIVKASALDVVNNTEKMNAINCFNESKMIMQELTDKGFNVQKINDTLKVTKELLDAQIDRERRGIKSDYSQINTYCLEIQNTKIEAYKAKDAAYSLEKEYSNFLANTAKYNINTSEVDSLITKTKQELNDERYTQVISLSPQVESKMIEVQSSATALNFFYKSFSNSLKDFFVKNIFLFIIIGVLIIVFIVVYKLKLRRMFIERKIAKLENEKKVVQSMIKDVQKNYFEKGLFSEGEYNIKTKKFAELIRDIERQIPLCLEELARVKSTDRKKKKENSSTKKD